MAAREMMTRDVYIRQIGNLIECPFQPGNLKISEQACLKRQQAAGTKKFDPRSSDDFFNYCISQGLIRCEKCSVIKKSTRRHSARPPALVS